eukprot:Colp12_sorted_trinity150504_noHs@21469
MAIEANSSSLAELTLELQEEKRKVKEYEQQIHYLRSLLSTKGIESQVVDGKKENVYKFNTIEEALADMAAGKIICVVDNEDRENEGDLIMAAEFCTTEQMAFIIRHTSGFICVAVDGERLDELELPLMVAANTEKHRTAFTISVDYVHDTTTGISASDRAITARALANPKAKAEEFLRPGHIMPLRPRPGGVLERPGHTEATVDLCKLSGLQPAGILCEVALDDGTMARRDYLFPFCAQHGIKIITIADLIEYRRKKETAK